MKALIIVLAAAAALAEPLAVELKPEAVVSARQVVLADLADLPADSPLRDIVIAPAPAPGGERLLRRGQIAVSLGKAGYRAGTFELSGAETVVVRRATRLLTPPELLAGLRELLGREVTIDRLPPLKPLPDGEVSFRLRQAPADPLPPRASVSLELLVGGRVHDEVTVCVSPVEQDPVVEPMAEPTARPGPEPPATPPAEEPAAAAPPAPKPTWRVERGDKLTVRVAAGRVVVSFVGEARGSGGAGDSIEVQTVIGTEKRSYLVRLVAPDRAVLEV